MRLVTKCGRGWCLFAGRLRIRWEGPDFRPLFSERYGFRKWRKVGRLGVRWVGVNDAGPSL